MFLCVRASIDVGESGSLIAAIQPLLDSGNGDRPRFPEVAKEKALACDGMAEMSFSFLILLGQVDPGVRCSRRSLGFF